MTNGSSVTESTSGMTNAQMKREKASIIRALDAIDERSAKARTPKQRAAVNAAIARVRIRIIALAREIGGSAFTHMMRPHDEPITGSNVVLFRPRQRVQMRTLA